MEPRDEKILSPEERSYLADAQRVMASPAYADDRHPGHLQALRSARRLMVAAYGEGQELADELNRPLDAAECVWGVR